MFSNQEVSAYYDNTQNHYEKWWKLKKNLSLHYGIWNENTKSFEQSLNNTNAILLQKSSISETDVVLDAGCGVGGSVFYIHAQTNARLIGITLSRKQAEFATSLALKRNVRNKVEFKVMDFTKTTFSDQSFDAIWACESICHAENKMEFIEESFRILKPGGRLVLSDFFLADEKQADKHSWIDKWKNTWGIPNFVTSTFFENSLMRVGFKNTETTDFTQKIHKSARRLYFASFLGALPSEIYNIFNPGVSKYAKSHYKSGYYQYKALKVNLWKYKVIFAEK